METLNNAAPVVTDIGLPELRDVLKAACVSGEPITLSHLAAGALYYAMTTPPAPAASQLGKARHPVLESGASDEALQKLKADAQALAADGANWSMDVGCMFVLAMIERIEAAADQQLAGYINPGDRPKLGQCRATLWAKPTTADAVPVFLGAPGAATDKARIAELEAEIADWMKCARDNQEMLNTIGRQLGGRIPEQLVSEVARQCVDRIAELEAMLAKRHRANFILSQTIHNIMVGNQSSWIEWQNGAGAESAMQWIENGLAGPGLIPQPGSKSAQEWFDANSDDRMEPSDPHAPGSALSAAPAAGSAS